MREVIIDKVLRLLAETKDSNYKIAKATKISESAIGRYVRGLSRPTFPNALLLQQYFDGTLTDIKLILKIEFVFLPLIPIHLQEEYPSRFESAEYIESLPKMPVIVDKKFKGNYRVFEVNGDSMEDGTKNSICDKDKILCREVHADLWKKKLPIKDWFFVIIHQFEGVILRKINNHDIHSGELICHSLNENFMDVKINIKDIREIFTVIKIVDRNARL